MLKIKFPFLALILLMAFSPGLCLAHFLTTIQVTVIDYDAQGRSVIETTKGNRYSLASKYLPKNFREKSRKSKYFPLTVLYSELSPLSKPKIKNKDNSQQIKMVTLPENIFYYPDTDIL